MEGHRIWRKAISSGKYFRPTDDDLPGGEMEMAGIFRAKVANGRPLELGAISAVTEIFDTKGLIVAQYARENKAQLTASLSQALKSYMRFREAEKKKYG